MLLSTHSLDALPKKAPLHRYACIIHDSSRPSRSSKCGCAAKQKAKFSFLAPGRRQVGGPGHAAGQAADVLLEVIVVLLQFAQVRLHVLAPIDQGVEAGLDFHCMTTKRISCLCDGDDEGTRG